MNKSHTMDNNQRLGLSTNLYPMNHSYNNNNDSHNNHNNYYNPARRPVSATFSHFYDKKTNNVPQPDYSPEVPRALRLPISIIDDDPQSNLRSSKNYRRNR